MALTEHRSLVGSTPTDDEDRGWTPVRCLRSSGPPALTEQARGRCGFTRSVVAVPVNPVSGSGGGGADAPQHAGNPPSDHRNRALRTRAGLATDPRAALIMGSVHRTLAAPCVLGIALGHCLQDWGGIDQAVGGVAHARAGPCRAGRTAPSLWGGCSDQFMAPNQRVNDPWVPRNRVPAIRALAHNRSGIARSDARHCGKRSEPPVPRGSRNPSGPQVRARAIAPG